MHVSSSERGLKRHSTIRVARQALRLLVPLLFLSGPATGVRAQGPTITVTAPGEVNPGDAVQVKVDLSGVESLGALLFDLAYDGSSLALQGIEAGGLGAQGLFAGNPEQFPSSSGMARFGFLHAEGISGDGTFVTLTFRLAAGAPSPLPLALANPTALSSAAAAQVVTTRDGAVVILLAVVSLKSGFQIASLPVRAANPDPAALLGEPAANVKLATWYPAAKEGQGDYVVYTGANVTFEPGRGYWLLLGADRQLRVTQGTPVDPSTSARVSVPKGWSLIGNPFRLPVVWDVAQIRVRRGLEEKTLAQAREAGWVEDYAWAWRQDEGSPLTGRYGLIYDAAVIPGVTSGLDTAAGCWFLANEACELLLPPPSSRAARGGDRALASRRRERSKGSWAVRLQARSRAGSGEVILGVAGEGQRGLAIGQPPNPPAGAASVDVASVQGELPLSVDVRAGGPPGRQEWRLSVSAAAPAPGEEVTLTWPDLSALPKDVRLTLVDEAANVRRYLRTTASYTLPLDESGRRLLLVAEPRTGPAIAITGLEVAGGPGRSGRAVRFSLSAAAAVDVAVMSPAGRTVRVLATRQASGAGQNQVTWPAGGLPGIYLVRVTATTEEGAAAQAVCPVIFTR
ncbi:MAG: hypothetical protein HY321_12800 [Armatimonadetes bacterium]|nr:hypothetical protein [Armatimonadota bacterium]